MSVFERRDSERLRVERDSESVYVHRISFVFSTAHSLDRAATEAKQRGAAVTQTLRVTSSHDVRVPDCVVCGALPRGWLFDV